MEVDEDGHYKLSDWEDEPCILYGFPSPERCSICQDAPRDHETSSCPFMVLAAQVDGYREKPSGLRVYFPPVPSEAERRAADFMREREMNMVRITNHLEFDDMDTLEQLFRRFGNVRHIYVPYKGGNGFVNFSNRAGALTAIKKLNGYAFKDDVILRVEWATKASCSRLLWPMSFMFSTFFAGLVCAGLHYGNSFMVLLWQSNGSVFKIPIPHLI